MRRSPGAALQAVLRYSAHSAGRSASPGSISPAEAGRRPGNGLAAAGHGERAPARRRVRRHEASGGRRVGRRVGGGKKRKHLDGDALAAAMATESPAQKKMAAAWETEAAAKSAEVALQLIQQLGSAPDAFKPLLEARIKKLLEDGNGPEAPPAAQ